VSIIECGLRVPTPIGPEDQKTLLPLFAHIPHPEGLPQNRDTMWIAKGCDKCGGLGYKGRIGLYEVMEITDEIRELILIGASSLELRKKSIEDGMITLRGSGLQKIRNGVTTIEEVLRETVA